MNKLIKKNSGDAVDYDFHKVFFGLFVVVFGLASLVNNLGIFSLNIDFSVLWPLFIIFVGLSLFSRKNIVSTIIGATVATLCIFLVFISFLSCVSVRYSGGIASVFPVSVSKDSGAEKANISLNAGAGEVKVYGIDSGKLVEGELTTNLATVKVDFKTKDNVQDVNIGIQRGRSWMKGGHFKNDFDLGIDKNTPLTFYINSGASNNNIDLTGVKAESVAIQTGASNVDLKMGDALDTADVVIEAGMSSINLSLPKTAGVKLVLESGMSSKDLPDFISAGKNVYQSLNYDSSQKKINVNIKMGMASLSVNWYEPEKKEKIFLFYYNQLEDKENTCDYSFIMPVEREVAADGDIIKNTVELLIEGQLTEKEKTDGFIADFSQDFRLLESNLSDNGTLTLEFTEVSGFTSGNSCQTGLLFEEILKTVRQFPQVKIIIFKPDSLFEPFI